MQLLQPFVAQCLWNTQPHTTSVLVGVPVVEGVPVVVPVGVNRRVVVAVKMMVVNRRGVRLVVDRDRGRDREVKLVSVEVPVVVPVEVPVVDSDSVMDSVTVEVMDLVTGLVMDLGGLEVDRRNKNRFRRIF
jgi:hypothetical protein